MVSIDSDDSDDRLLTASHLESSPFEAYPYWARADSKAHRIARFTIDRAKELHLTGRSQCTVCEKEELECFKVPERVNCAYCTARKEKCSLNIRSIASGSTR